MLEIKKTAQLQGHQGSVFGLVQGRDAQHILSSGGDGWVVEWNLDKPDLGKLMAKVDTQVFSLATIPDSLRAVVGDMNGGVHWLDFSDVNATRDIAQHLKGTFSIRYFEELLWTAGGDGTLTQWNPDTMRTLNSIQLSTHSLRVLATCASRSEIAVGTSDRYIYIVDSQTLDIKTRIENAHQNSVFALCYSSDNRYLISGGRDAQLRVWNIENNYECISEQSAHWFTINDIAYHPTQPVFATASRDKTIRIWDGVTFELIKALDTIRDGGHINSVNRLLWTPDGQQLISCSDDRSLIVWSCSF